MPAFSFEKISSAPVRPAAPMAAMAAAKSRGVTRGVIVQLLDKITEARLQRDATILQRSQRAIGYTEADVTPQRTRG
ncbi:MAG: hypothetical protein EKK40_08755 [Bradyrhizobiaceae bacterium]|nr:MAG: hypothetical protein EKK40_08755 [Bradyrhizobiaceae bacterium]